MAGHDIGEETVNVRVRSCFLGCSENIETFTVGGAHWALLARIGGVIAKF